MGAAASFSSLPDTLDEPTCRAIIGHSFDENLFYGLAVNGVIPKAKFMEAMEERTDVFLTHDWGMDGGIDNHARVSEINRALKARGLKTWFDEEQMQGNVKKQMIRGIDYAQCVVVFVTRRYVDKVKGDNAEDNCQLEFNYAAMRKTGSKMLAVVMEERMRNTKAWGGEVAMVLGGRLYMDFAGDFSNVAYFNKACDDLYTSIIGLIGAPVLGASYSAPVAGLPTAAAPSSPVPTPPMAIGSSHKALGELSHDDCIALLEALHLGDYSSSFQQHGVTGEILGLCESADDLKELGVSVTLKARLLNTKLVEFKRSGVPNDYLHDAKVEKQRLEEARIEAERKRQEDEKRKRKEEEEQRRREEAERAERERREEAERAERERREEAEMLERQRREEEERRLGEYLIVGPDGARVRAGVERDSPFVVDLDPLQTVHVVEIKEDRARITAPNNGWTSLVSSLGTTLLLQRSKFFKMKVVGPDGAKIRRLEDRNSAEVTELSTGTTVTACEIKDNRVHIIYPCHGWGSVVAQSGVVVLAPEQ